MAITLLLFLTILLTFFFTYLKLIFKCKRAVRVSVESFKLIKKSHHAAGQVLVQPPGPLPLPILGNLTLLGKFTNAFEGFTALSEIYGGIYSLTLGSIRCVVLSDLELIKEVLNQNSKFFGGRPKFERFQRIFGGNKENSVVFADWSSFHHQRGNLSRKFCLPRNNTDLFRKMNDAGCLETQTFINRLKLEIRSEKEVHLKPSIQEACANLFFRYMCSTSFDYDDKDFKKFVNNFDEIFFDMTLGYAVDFLPWLSPFYQSHMKKLDLWTSNIRQFLLNRIVNEKKIKLENQPETDDDFMDTLLRAIKTEEGYTEDNVLYMFENLFGGFSGVGNVVYIILGFIAKNPKIGKRIQEEIKEITDKTGRGITLNDIDDMPFTIATYFECLRYQSSPTIPHIATENTQIGGYGILKGTHIFINNFYLNKSEKYWDNPENFEPERFLKLVPAQELDQKTSLNAPHVLRVNKSIPQFIPFSTGKRTCIGEKILRNFCFLMVTHILEHFDISTENPENIKTYPASVGLPPDTYPLKLNPRF